MMSTNLTILKEKWWTGSNTWNDKDTGTEEDTEQSCIRNMRKKEKNNREAL